VAVALNAVIAGAAYIQGFEGSGPFNFYNDPGSSAGISTTVAYSGSQSAEFTLDNEPFAYTRWKSEDLSSYGLTLNNVIASDWVMRTDGRSDLSPYLIFSVATPNDPNPDDTMIIQFSMTSIADNTWTQNTIDRNSTTFHVVGDRTGLTPGTFDASGTQGTLDQLAATTYSGSTTWGDLPVTYVRISVGEWDASQTWHGYADDLTVVPEPGTLTLLGLAGLSGLAMMWIRRRRSNG